MKLLLVRHGETFANDAQRWSGSQDLDITNLTENGKNQAKKTRFLKLSSIRVYY